MELLIYTIGIFLLGTLFQSTARKARIYSVRFRKWVLTEHSPNLIRKTILIFFRSLFSFIKTFLPFIHRITPINVAFTFIIAGPLYSWASLYFDQYEHIECKSGYAIEVHPGTYVPCSDINTYWESEHVGTRLTTLELKTNTNSIIEEKLK